MAKRDTYNYTLRDGRKVVHRGITNDPERREREHQQELPNAKLTAEGRAKTREVAQCVERTQSKMRGYDT